MFEGYRICFRIHLFRLFLGCCFLLFIYLFLFVLGKSKEAEKKRTNKELANIRSKFKGKMSLYC